MPSIPKSILNNLERVRAERDDLRAKCEELETENKRLRAELVTGCMTVDCNKPSCPVRRGFVKPGSCPWCKHD